MLTTSNCWWSRHFLTEAAKRGYTEHFPVPLLLELLDQPAPHGFDRDLKHLILAVFALDQQLAWYQHGTKVEVNALQAINDQLELRHPPMPSPEAWDKAVAHGKPLFGKPLPQWRSPATLGELAGTMREVARQYAAHAAALVTGLTEHADILGLHEGSGRLGTVRRVVALLKAIADEWDDVVLVDLVAQADVGGIDFAAAGTAFKQAPAVNTALAGTPWPLLEAAVGRAASDERFRLVVEELRAAARHDQHAVDLVTALRVAADKTARLLAGPPVVDPPPPVVIPPVIGPPVVTPPAVVPAPRRATRGDPHRGGPGWRRHRHQQELSAGRARASDLGTAAVSGDQANAVRRKVEAWLAEQGLRDRHRAARASGVGRRAGAAVRGHLGAGGHLPDAPGSPGRTARPGRRRAARAADRVERCRTGRRPAGAPEPPHRPQRRSVGPGQPDCSADGYPTSTRPWYVPAGGSPTRSPISPPRRGGHGPAATCSPATTRCGASPAELLGIDRQQIDSAGLLQWSTDAPALLRFRDLPPAVADGVGGFLVEVAGPAAVPIMAAVRSRARRRTPSRSGCSPGCCGRPRRRPVPRRSRWPGPGWSRVGRARLTDQQAGALREAAEAWMDRVNESGTRTKRNGCCARAEGIAAEIGITERLPRRRSCPAASPSGCGPSPPPSGPPCPPERRPTRRGRQRPGPAAPRSNTGRPTRARVETARMAVRLLRWLSTPDERHRRRCYEALQRQVRRTAGWTGRGWTCSPATPTRRWPRRTTLLHRAVDARRARHDQQFADLLAAATAAEARAGRHAARRGRARPGGASRSSTAGGGCCCWCWTG